MSIDHSAAFVALEKYAVRAEKKPIMFPIVQDEIGSVFARPLTASQMDRVDKATGHEYNVRLCMAACVDENDHLIFNPEDFAGLYASRGTVSAFATAANQIISAQTIDYAALKKL